MVLLDIADQPAAKKGGKQEGLFLLAGPPDSVKKAGGPVAGIFGGRGGGRPGRYQGKAAFLEKAPEALEVMKGVGK